MKQNSNNLDTYNTAPGNSDNNGYWETIYLGKN